MAIDTRATITGRKGEPIIKKSLTNRYMYQAQLCRRAVMRTKPNKWAIQHSVDPCVPMVRLLRLPVKSNIKGFIWLLVNHALPVRDRHFGDDPD